MSNDDETMAMVAYLKDRLAAERADNAALRAQLEGALADLEFATRRFAELTDMLRQASR